MSLIFINDNYVGLLKKLTNEAESLKIKADFKEKKW